MRIYLVTAAAAAAFIVALAVSQIAGGAVRAAFIFGAIVAGNLAVGFGAAALIGSWQQRQRGLGSLDHRVRMALGIRPPKRTCTECHRPMTRVGDYMVCPSCDRIAVA